MKMKVIAFAIALALCAAGCSAGVGGPSESHVAYSGEPADLGAHSEGEMSWSGLAGFYDAVVNDGRRSDPLPVPEAGGGFEFELTAYGVPYELPGAEPGSEWALLDDWFWLRVDGLGDIGASAGDRVLVSGPLEVGVWGEYARAELRGAESWSLSSPGGGGVQVGSAFGAGSWDAPPVDALEGTDLLRRGVYVTYRAQVSAVAGDRLLVRVWDKHDGGWDGRTSKWGGWLYLGNRDDPGALVGDVVEFEEQGSLDLLEYLNELGFSVNHPIYPHGDVTVVWRGDGSALS